MTQADFRHLIGWSSVNSGDWAGSHIVMPDRLASQNGGIFNAQFPLALGDFWVVMFSGRGTYTPSALTKFNWRFTIDRV